MTDKPVDWRETTSAPLLDRRDALAALGALGPVLLFGCGSSTGVADAGPEASTPGDGSAGEAGVTSAESGTCSVIPDETGGPYPDVNGMISKTAFQRSNITEGLTGTPLTLTLQVVDIGNACAPVVGALVIIWHCDANGVYSEYATSMNSAQAQNDVGSTTTTYLRGWQTTDATGSVTFITIYPGWYTPRVTHIHIMVYKPTDLTTPIKTTQFAFPDSVNEAVYAQASLYAKGQNTTTLSTDMVFGSSSENLVTTVTGSTTSGYTATLPVGLASY